MAAKHFNDKEDSDELIPTYEDTNESYMNFVEANGGMGIDPLSTEGLQIQARYLQKLGPNQHPMDVLRRISLNPFCATKDRISAAKGIMEYSMRKVPAQLELTGAGGKPLSIGPEALKQLSNDEIDQLLKLLEKANTGLKE